MVFTLIILEMAVLVILSAIHWNWVFGGVWGFDHAIPTDSEGKRIIDPKIIESSIVAIGLLTFATYYLFLSELISIDLPNWVSVYLGWGISSIFILRSIGDFKYVGFFKRIKTTKFGRSDTKIFSPLCLFIGLIGIIIELYK